MNIFPSLLMLVFLLPGCEMLGLTDGESKKKADEAAAAKAKADAEKIALDTDEEDYEYNPIGKRDPFKSFLTRNDDNDGDDTFARTALQKYNITQYNLVGIIWGVERPRALVQDPKGQGHVMELGTYIGKNWGKVTNIQDNSVIITEEYTTNQGELVVETIEMRLRKSDVDLGQEF